LLTLLGVLTKPDTVDQADTEIWENIMHGKSHALHYGYYMTRLPRSDEMKMTPDEARTKELNFLNGHEVWRKLGRDRLGSQKLASSLSDRLAEMIQQMFVSFK
jgi:Dynamin central region